MAVLKLNLLKTSLDQPVANAAVVTIRQLEDAGGAYPRDPFERKAAIPASSAGSTEIAVPDGRYHLSARLPGGETLAQTVSVQGAEVEAVTFDAGRSPHEWLSWQTLAGGVRARSAQSSDLLDESIERRGWRFSPESEPAEIDGRRGEAAVTIGRPSAIPPRFAPGPADDSAGGFEPDRGFDGDALAAGDGIPAFADADFYASESPAAAPDILLGRADVAADAPRATLTIRPGHVSFEGVIQTPVELSAYENADERLQSWTLAPRSFNAPDHPGGRFLAIVDQGTHWSAAVLPVPWRLTHGPENTAGVDILFDRAAPPARAVRVTLHEPEFIALLSYLGAGRMGDAAAALGEGDLDDHLTRMIADKMINPMAACGAAYVGLATSGQSEKRDRWVPWLENLMDSFPDLPDGAILFAMFLRDRCASRDDLMRVKAALKLGYQRGAPLYVAGLQHLLNGLQLFADPAAEKLFDPACEQMFDQVALSAARADPTQPFTVLTHEGPAPVPPADPA